MCGFWAEEEERSGLSQSRRVKVSPPGVLRVCVRGDGDLAGGTASRGRGGPLSCMEFPRASFCPVP